MNLTIEERTVAHNTFVIERNYSASPEKVFAALSDPARKRRWYVEGGSHEVKGFEMDFRVGGSEHASYLLTQGPVQGMTLTNDGTYQVIVPNRRVVIASTMSLGGRAISASLATFELVPNERGTSLIFTHQGAFFEGADGPQMREAGWQKLLEQLDASLKA